MKIRILGGVGLVWMALACGGIAKVGSSVGPYAASVAEYQTNDVGLPCPTFNIGEEFTLNNFTIRVTGASVAQPENSLPWIGNSSERKTASKENIEALIIEYEFRNDSPVKVGPNLSLSIRTNDGERPWSLPYNGNLIQEELGIEDAPRKYPPNKWVKRIWVVGAEKGSGEGAVAYFAHETKEYDPTDPRGKRKIDVTHDHAVVDLGTPEQRPHMNPKKR